MLDQMIESRSHAGEGNTRNGLLLTTGLVLISLFSFGFLYSLFAVNIGVGGEGLELSTLVAPVPLPEEVPPEPEPEEPDKKINKNPDVDIRKEIIANINETPTKPPKEIKTTRADIPERRLDRVTMLGDSNQNTLSNVKRETTVAPGKASSIGDGNPNDSAPKTVEQPKTAPPPPPPPKKEPPPVPKRISQGVINGKAVSLPKPAYPPAARAVRASGAVNVSVVISKDGSVMSASANSGHPLLRAAAVSAARRARFAPTLLSGQPVEVSGVIVYNFQP